MVYPNNRYMLRSPGRHFGPATGLGVFARARGDRLNRFVSETYSRAASTPDGYGATVTVAPLTAGGMASAAFIAVTTSGTAIAGRTLDGTSSVSLTPAEPSLSLVVSMDGTASVSITLTGPIAGVVGMDGTATITLESSGVNLGATVPFEGTATISATGAANLKGLLSMSGESTPFAELSPASLAAAVLNSTIEGDITTVGTLRVILSAIAGKADGGGTTTITFRDTTDSKDRIVATVDSSGNRSAVTLDAS